MNSAARDETILWRWPAGWRERMRAGGRFYAPTGREVLLVSGVSLALVPLLMFTARAGMPSLVQAVGIVAGCFAIFVAWFVGFTRLYVGYNRVSQLILTTDRVRHAIGFPWPRETSIPRADVRSVVIYEGEGTVIMQGADRELLRARHVGEAAGFAAALGAPTVAWPVRRAGDPHLRSAFLTWSMIPVAAVISLPLFIGALALAAIAGELLSRPLVYIAALFGWDGGGVIFVVVSLMVLIAAMIPVVAITLFCGVAFARLLFRPDNLHDFLYFYSGNPWLQYGRRAPFRMTFVGRLTNPYVAWCARILGAGSVPERRPDLRYDATQDMAARATAEGAP